MMLARFKMHPMIRALGVFGAIAAVTTGATFAILQSQATLTDSTISSATANLKVWDGSAYNPSGPGFTVSGLVPGHGSGELPFYLQNADNLDLNITAHVPALPGPPSGGYGFTGFENLKVTITSNSPVCISGVHSVVTNMAALNAGEVPMPCNQLHGLATGNGGVLATEGNYKVNFDINPAFVTGGHAGVGPFDIVFTGTQL